MSILNTTLTWLGRAFSENGQPSSSRIVSAWLSVSSMALIWFIIRHMMSQPVDKVAVWIGNLPLVIGSLATFSTAPYGIGKIVSAFKSDKDNKDDKGA
jgi:hypothetical protein